MKRGRSRSKSLVRAKKRRAARIGLRHDRDSVARAQQRRRRRQIDPYVPSDYELYLQYQAYVPSWEQSRMLAQLRKPLPTNFRIRDVCPHTTKDVFDSLHQRYRNGRISISRIPSIPDSWQVVCPNGKLPYDLRRWLAKCTKLGYVSRQEFVSMLPVHLLQIQSHHQVLDLCASPGSKTVQAVDALYADGSRVPTGYVIANEIDARRAYVLSHRCKTMLKERHQSIAICCHNAIKFPNVHAGLRRNEESSNHDSAHNALFDRVVCDVPYSGDGTLRKDTKVWKTWHPQYGIELHSTQLRIAKRGVALLKIGGIMAYSTCSFHPIENEAVVAALLATGTVEIMQQNNNHPVLRGIRTRPGLTMWKVYGDDFTELSYAENSHLPHTLWPPSKDSDTSVKQRLRHCIRMVPHDNDTGGFFIAMLRKIRDFPVKETTHANAAVLQTGASKEPIVTPTAMHHRLCECDGKDLDNIDSGSTGNSNDDRTTLVRRGSMEA